MQFPPALLDAVERIPPKTRAIYGAVALLAIAILGFTSYQFSKTTGYVKLFSYPLAADQLAEVENHLDQDGIPYEAGVDGVSVPPSKKGDEIMKFIIEHVPHKTLRGTADLATSTNPMTPSAVVEQQRLDGIAGNIAMDLRTIPGVVDAHVKIAPAQVAQLIGDPEHPASADVWLTVESGTTLPPESISGIRDSVAASVAGLEPDHVTVNDQSGKNLAVAATGTGDVDEKLQASIDETLDRVFGPHNAFARVNVEVRDSSSTLHEVKHVAMADKPISTAADREHYVSKSKSYDKVHEDTDRGSDTIETSTQTAAGGIRRKTVAVFVNDRLSPMPSVADLSSAIGAVAGIDLTRGDAITVTALAMAATPAPLPAVPNPASSAMPAAMLATTFDGVAWPKLMLIFVFVGSLSYLGWLYMPQSLGRKDHVPVVAAHEFAEDLEPQRLHAALRDEPPHTAAAILATYPSPTATAVLELYGPDERREIVKRLTRTISPIVRDVSESAARG